MSNAGDGRAGRLILPLSLLCFAALGLVMIVLYPDSHQQDGGNHYLQALWAWRHPQLFVGVWSRPLFTTAYALPALMGYPAAKAFTLLVTLATAWQTAKLAEALGLARSSLAAAFLLVQPVVLLLFVETMTEPLFGLVFIVGLRLHHAGRIGAGALVASLLVLARPEGAFFCAMWGAWLLLRRQWKLLPLLGAGAALWWLAALVISGDPLFIPHHWPPDWRVTGAVYGHGTPFGFLPRMAEIAGPIFLIPFTLGLVVLLRGRRATTLTSSFLFFFIFHSLMWTFGMFGSGGYPRYFVCVAPATALIALEGWNALVARVPRLGSLPVLIPSLAISAFVGFGYVDAHVWSRDAQAIDAAVRWLDEHPVRVDRMIWSQAYMAIRMGPDPWNQPPIGSDRDRNLETLRRQPIGTLVFWDGETGPAWYHLRPEDFEAAGFRRLWSKTWMLEGWLLRRPIFGWGGPRAQETHLLYKSG